MAYPFETVKLDKGMYSESGSSFTKVLEKCDPSEQYKGTPLEHLDAFQRQLKRFDIKVKGADSDVVSKFFATWESAVLFPEYVARGAREWRRATSSPSSPPRRPESPGWTTAPSPPSLWRMTRP